MLFDAPMPRPPRVRPRVVLLLMAIGLWSGSVACLWTYESALVFRAGHSKGPKPIPGPGLVELTTRDGVCLDALSLPDGGKSAYWILFCPPSGRTIHGYVRRQLESLRAAGFNVFAFDYRGFGRNRGTPSEAGIYEDGLTAYRHLTEDVGVAPDRIILAGRSLGSAVAVELATRVPSGGLLLLSAIDSVPATASRFTPWAPVHWIASQRFDSLAKANRVRVPVLQVHAPEDWLVPIEGARRLFARFPGRKELLELPGGHNNVGFSITRSSEVNEVLRRALERFWSTPR